MANLSAYQRLRKANLNENTELLMQYGLQAPVVETSSVTLVVEDVKEKKPPSKPKQPVKKKSKEKYQFVERRTSFRVRLKVQQETYEDYESLKDSDEDDEDRFENDAELMKNLSQPNRNIVRPPRPNTYGSIEGVKVGTWWETRLDCNFDGIHRPTVAGIHMGPDGAYSVALSGGYEDDVDLGDSFTYTGEGGRDLKGTASNPKNLRTAPQSKDQQLTRGNLALSRNVETGNPVRVIRGYKLRSKFAPERGYRYDGLYKITRYWESYGKSGFKVYKFDFLRCDPEPAPWHKSTNKTSPMHEKSLDTVDVKKGGEDTQNTPEAEDSQWQGWPDNCLLPKIDCLTIKCGDDEEKVCLIGDSWIPVENVPQNFTDSSPCGGNKTDLKNRKSDFRNLNEITCNSTYELDEYDNCKFDNTCGWLGWSEGGFSTLDCPSTFNCILLDNC